MRINFLQKDVTIDKLAALDAIGNDSRKLIDPDYAKAKIMKFLHAADICEKYIFSITLKKIKLQKEIKIRKNNMLSNELSNKPITSWRSILDTDSVVADKEEECEELIALVRWLSEKREFFLRLYYLCRSSINENVVLGIDGEPIK